MTKYTIKYTTQFKKDYKLAKRQNKNIQLLKDLVALLADGKTLPKKYNDHPLQGNNNILFHKFYYFCESMVSKQQIQRSFLTQ